MNDTPVQSIHTLGVHRGAIDQETITTQPPPSVMKRVKSVLESMGIEIQVESAYKYRCIRARRTSVGSPTEAFGATSVDINSEDENVSPASPQTTPKAPNQPLPSNVCDPEETAGTGGAATPSNIVYGDRADEPGDEVRFSVELTRLDRLDDTYSVDIRRLKGNLRSYKFLYDTVKERANLQV